MRRSIFARTIVGFLSAAPLFAFQNPPPPPIDAPPAAQPAPPLGGPAVNVAEAPGAYMAFGGDARTARMARSNLRQYAAIFEELALSDDQRRQARAIMREYLDEMRAFQQEHRAEMQRWRNQAGLGDRPAEAPRRAAPDDGKNQTPPRRPATDPAPSARPTPRPEAPSDDRPSAPRRPAPAAQPGAPEAPALHSPESKTAASEARAQLEALRQAAPPQEPYMKRLYALLTADQQADFAKRMEARREAQTQEQLKRRLEAAGIDPQAKQDQEGMKVGPDGRPTIDESQLTPQSRQRLRQLRERQARILENRRRGNPAPPTPDDIEFENPER